MPKQTTPDQVIEKFEKLDLVGKVQAFQKMQQILEDEKKEANNRLEELSKLNIPVKQ